MAREIFVYDGIVITRWYRGVDAFYKLSAEQHLTKEEFLKVLKGMTKAVEEKE